MNQKPQQRRTQAQRRAESRQAVLDSASRLFGEKGYADTSLEEIAADCGLTIRPIYHYFGNKKALFAAVNESMEQRILEAMQGGNDMAASNWKSFLDLCEDAAFRRIVLVDSPNILGRERWTTSPVGRRTLTEPIDLNARPAEEQFRLTLLERVTMAAFAEAALAVAEAEDIGMARKQAEQLMNALFNNQNSKG